jgi:malonate-semialdehyde dehydrogenase (acetylating) / methylmalonate-semialdehyde dehydrogenase
MRDIPHFIGGAAVPATGSRFGDVFDPNSGRVQARVGLGDAALLDASRAARRPTRSAGRG